MPFVIKSQILFRNNLSKIYRKRIHRKQRTLLREIIEKSSNMEIHHAYRLRKCVIRTAMAPNLLINSLKHKQIPVDFFLTEIDKVILKFVWRSQNQFKSLHHLMARLLTKLPQTRLW